METNDLTSAIIGAAIEVDRLLGSAWLGSLSIALVPSKC